MVIADLVVVQATGKVSMGVLSEAVKAIVDTLNAAAGRLQDSSDHLTRNLALLEIALALVAVMQGERPTALLRKVLTVATWLWIIGEFHSIGRSFMHMLVDAATGAFGSHSTIVLQPSKILEMSTNVTKPMLDKLNAAQIPLTPGTMLLLGLVLLAIMVAYIALALSVSLAVIEFYLYLALSGLLMPFAVLGHTRFLADKAINAVIACSLKLAVITFITGTIEPILSKLKFEPGYWNEMTWRSIWALLVVVGLASALAIWAPRVAAGFLHASPSLSGTAVVAQAASVGASILSAGVSAAAAAWGASRGAASAVEALAGAGSSSSGDGGGGRPAASGPIYVFVADQQQLKPPPKPALPETASSEPLLLSGGEA